MIVNPDRLNRALRTALVTTALGLVSTAALAQVPIVRPGAPGLPGRQIDVGEATDLAATRFSVADVKFMQDMIVHHQQAVDMSALVADRTGRNELIDVARRIESSQIDEIAFMKGWLAERGQEVPDPAAHDHMHMERKMTGMATPEQMAELAGANGAAFDNLFLQLMIRHHQGALTMVEDLLKQPGSAYDPVLFEFTTDITNDQKAEIERMTGMLAGFSPDPRVGLAAGHRDAGEAIHNLELLASLPRPQGFYDPENPIGLPLSRLAADEEEDAEEDAEEEEEEEARDRNRDRNARAPFLNFSNTDMAFAGNTLFVGNYHGFNIYDLGEDGIPELLSSVVCPGGQGDVSIAGNLLIMSVEQTRGRLDCGLEGVAEKVSEERFRGLRIFDISDLRMPRQVGAVQTCRGSHTHSIVKWPDDDGKLIVYNSGTGPVRDDEELAGCSAELPLRDDKTALFRIDIIEIPVDRPQDARIVDSPAVFADRETGALAGLWQGGDHGPDTQTTNRTDHCHDITSFPALGIAAGACSGNGVIFDISDPLEPKRIFEVTDPSFAYWHSATFNNDGTKVIFTDEWGGGGRPRCRASDPLTWGADAIYDIVDGKLEFRSYYKMPAPQTDEENCVAHNGTIIPVPGRDIYVQSWYQGGISVMDFTDSANPFEIAYFDRGPIDGKDMILGGFWSSYWYKGRIYGSEIVRGLDVLAPTASEYLTENEIAAASMTVGREAFNPQQQFRIGWRAEPAVARAYIDQLRRDDALDAGRADALADVLGRAEAGLAGGGRDRGLARELDDLAKAVTRDAGKADALARNRLSALGVTLGGIAARLR